MKKKALTEKSWNSLCDVRDRILADGKEKIVAFDGFQLTTNKHRYTLAFNTLTMEAV